MRREILQRNCQVMLIPSGHVIEVPAGTVVEVVQAKGHGISLNLHGQLVRMESRDLDALGTGLLQDAFYSQVFQETQATAGLEQPDSRAVVSEQAVWQALRQCFDPEIPVNIVELGLIYDCKIEQHKVSISMTLTSPGCGMGPVLVDDVKKAVQAVEHVAEVEVDLVFSPPWSQDLLSEAAKLELGLL